MSLAYSGALRRLAVEAAKVASDLRLLSMGPRAGIAEIELPAVQPGSSIMPGKVNPSVPEMVNQVCCQVFGCDAAILAAGDAGQLELNVMMPVIAWNALHATTILGRGDARVFDATASTASRPTPPAAASSSIAAPRWRPRSARTSATLRPRRSPSCRSQTGRPIREIVRERRLMPDVRSMRFCRAEAMTSPGIPGREATEGATKARTDRPEDARSRSRGGTRAGRQLPPASAQQRQQHGKLFPPENLPELEGPDRDVWQRPDQIMDALNIAEGSVVADLGAGSGWFTIRLARRVGPNGTGLRRGHPARR